MIAGLALLFLLAIHSASCEDDDLVPTPGCFPANPNGTSLSPQSLVGAWFLVSHLGMGEGAAHLALYITPVSNVGVASTDAYVWDMQGDFGGECERRFGDNTANVSAGGKIQVQQKGNFGLGREHTVLSLQDDLLILFRCFKASGNNQCSNSFVVVGTRKSPLALRDEETVAIAKKVDDALKQYCVKASDFKPISHSVEKPRCPGKALSYEDYLAR